MNQPTFEFITGQAAEYSGSKHHLYKKERYVIDSITGCWNWQLRITEKGYGATWDPIKKMMRGAHIIEYEKKYGPVPEGKILDHFKCQNRKCCNPDHVEPVSDLENVHRGKSIKLTTEQVNKIRELHPSISSRKLAIMFGCVKSTILNIVNNKSRKDM